MLRSLTKLVALLATIAAIAGVTADGASAARGVGFDSTHNFRMDTSFYGQILECSTDLFTGTGTVRVGYPTKIISPVAGWVNFSANLQRLNAGQPVFWGESKPWYRNYAYPSGDLYYSLYFERDTGRWSYARTVGWANLPAGTYRLNLLFYWESDRRLAAYETDWCTVG